MSELTLAECPQHGAYMAHQGTCPVCEHNEIFWPNAKTTDGRVYAAAWETMPLVESIQLLSDATYNITRFTVYGEPIPKARARFGVGKTYDPEKNRNYKKLIQDTLGSVGTFYEKDIQLGVAMLFYRKNNVKADTDNLTKAIFDACNKKLWDDDKQIRASYNEVHYADENPRAEIIVCPIAHFRDELKTLLDKLGQ